MAYETITVRMNRSSATIPWGISIRSAGAGALSIASVERESLADKAGVQVNDTITQLGGRDAKSMALHEANAFINTPSDEIYLLLQRYVTSHPTLPWELNEQDNKIVVDQVRPQQVKSLQGSESRNQFSSHSTSSYQVPPPIHHDSGSYHSSSYSKFSEEKREGGTVPQYQPAPFNNVTNAKTYDGSTHMRQGFQNSYASDSYTKTESHQGGVPHPGSQHTQQQYHQEFSGGGSRSVPIAVSYTNVPANAPPPHANPQYHTASHYTPQPPTHVDTGYGASFPSRRTGQIRTKSESSYRDEGPHVAFGHSPRTRRQLSPNASIQHLQYNSPMNMYSQESAAEQYLRQTGGLFGTESGGRVKSIDHHVAATRHSPAIVKPIADRATPNTGTAYFTTSGGEQATEHHAQNTVRDQVHQASPLVSSIPAPPPPPPANTIGSYSTNVNPVKAPSSMTTGHYSPVPPLQRPTSVNYQEASQQSPPGRRSRTSSASVHHLQYNSPMNLYSMETAAEQYLKQTGGLFGTETNAELLKSKDPSYLHSETRRLIAEEEAGMGRRSASPAQSSSFKRIAVATGTPME